MTEFEDHRRAMDEYLATLRLVADVVFEDAEPTDDSLLQEQLLLRSGADALATAMSFSLDLLPRLGDLHVADWRWLIGAVIDFWRVTYVINLVHARACVGCGDAPSCN